MLHFYECELHKHNYCNIYSCYCCILLQNTVYSEHLMQQMRYSCIRYMKPFFTEPSIANPYDDLRCKSSGRRNN